MLGWEEGSLSDIDIGGLGGLVALVWCVRSQDNSSGCALVEDWSFLGSTIPELD